jgi:hypothetical protein
MRTFASFSLLVLSAVPALASVIPSNLDGTLPTQAFLDPSSGLYWSEMRALGAGTFAQASSAVKDADFEGLTGWRLPTVNEFHALYRTQGHNGVGTMLVSPFSGPLTPTAYWTSEFNARDGTYMTWSPFLDGTSIALPGSNRSIWAVRAVPEPSTWVLSALGALALGLRLRGSRRVVAT